MPSKEKRYGCTDAAETGSYNYDLIAVSRDSRSYRNNETGLASFADIP
jgi:hypothetical protein